MARCLTYRSPQSLEELIRARSSPAPTSRPQVAILPTSRCVIDALRLHYPRRKLRHAHTLVVVRGRMARERSSSTKQRGVLILHDPCCRPSNRVLSKHATSPMRHMSHAPQPGA